VNRKKNLFVTLRGAVLVAAILVCQRPAFSQAATATSPAPAESKPAGQAGDPIPGIEELSAYQKTQLIKTFNDWAFLAKYREADKALPPPAPGEARVVFMGDSITEGWE